MVTLSARWEKVLEADILRRSSQILSVLDRKAYVFGGELQPRTPRDNDVHIVALDGQASLSVARSAFTAPSPRVGTASTTLNGKIYLFSGRGGVAMAPIEEFGALWAFDPPTAAWSLISPTETSSGAYPSARSYHCVASDGEDVIYIHAGCPENGRLSDLWAFSVSKGKWTELAGAPDPPRGGTSIAFINGRLYRMNGFDGKTEQGGILDVYTPNENKWASIPYTSDGVSGPAPRSVSVLVPVRVDGGTYLVTMFGERDPSSLGHQGAGKMLGDVWTYHVESQMWSEAVVEGGVLPAARGWFDADVIGNDTIVVQGGLGESNERLNDIWTLHMRRQ